MSIPPKMTDPFLMSEDEATELVVEYLKKDFIIKHVSKGRTSGVDIIACNKKNASYFYIESKGNIKNDYIVKEQFTGLQIAHHFDVQVGQLCELITRYSKEPSARFGMANPDIPRIRNRVEAKKDALKLLPIELIWVSPLRVYLEKLGK